MNRLWVRLSLMMSGVLFLVFFIQFLSIILEPTSAANAPASQTGRLSRQGDAPADEITRRLFIWMGFSIAVGVAGGVIISRMISAPVSALAKATHRIGAGDLNVRVPRRGSLEMIELADTFNKMAADLQNSETLRNNLMADVSHELRTPLTVLEGNLRAALDHVFLLDEAEIANLYGQTHHLIRLVNDLRELSLAESRQLQMEKQPTDLNALIVETLQSVEPLANEKGVQLADQTGHLGEVAVDPFRIRQVLFNLLSNALRHTSPGGEIIVSGERGGGQVSLAVRDSGEGLEPDQLRAVFDRFYRGDKSRSRETGSTGLGLAIVKAIVEAHGGRIEASSPGKGLGSKFSLYLPLSQS
jgi:signal transduction histidine kinase